MKMTRNCEFHCISPIKCARIPPTMKPIIFILAALLTLSGCEQVNQKLGLEDPAKKEARAEAEGKAVGSACRQSGRAIEDCYSIYSWLPKAAIYGGWKEMDAYMRENQLETVTPQLPPPQPPSNGKKKKEKAEATGESAEPDDKPEKQEKSAEKHSPKH